MNKPAGTAGLKYRKTAGAGEKLLESLGKMLEEDGGILFAYVHGSLVEKGFFRDVDVAVWIRNPGDAFKYEVNVSARLEVCLNIPIDLHVLNMAPLPFKHHVLTRGRLLFSRDEAERMRIVDETIRQYADLSLLRFLSGEA